MEKADSSLVSIPRACCKCRAFPAGCEDVFVGPFGEDVFRQFTLVLYILRPEHLADECRFCVGLRLPLRSWPLLFQWCWAPREVALDASSAAGWAVVRTCAQKHDRDCVLKNIYVVSSRMRPIHSPV